MTLAGLSALVQAGAARFPHSDGLRLPKDESLRGHCETGEAETEMRFPLHCENHTGLKQTKKIISFHSFPQFKELTDINRFSVLPGEGSTAALNIVG